jgi:hypothetical protein
MATYKTIAEKYNHIAHDESDGQSKMDDVIRKRRVRMEVSSLITATSERTIMTAEADCEILSAEIIPDNALTANNTNYATLTLGSADGAGGAVTAFDSFTTEITGTGDWVQGVPEPFTIVPSTDTLDEGEALILVTAKAASGIAVEATIEVEYRLL